MYIWSGVHFVEIYINIYTLVEIYIKIYTRHILTRLYLIFTPLYLRKYKFLIEVCKISSNKATKW